VVANGDRRTSIIGLSEADEKKDRSRAHQLV